jgi:hypothetical protein
VSAQSEPPFANTNDEWRSMILFGLYTGQRLGDEAKRETRLRRNFYLASGLPASTHQ